MTAFAVVSLWLLAGDFDYRDNFAQNRSFDIQIGPGVVGQ